MSGLTTVSIQNKTCHIYEHGDIAGSGRKGVTGKDHRLPVFYWGVGEEDRASAEAAVSYLESRIAKRRTPDAQGSDGAVSPGAFILAAYEVENWNDAFSPWVAPAVFGRDAFGGKADGTLEWLLHDCIPYVEKNVSETARFSVGYSLAGLFGLWVYCECDLFAGAVSCSGSLWYEGWLDYVQRAAADRAGGGNYIYLSLGDREEKTKNRQLAAVGDNTRTVYRLLCGEQGNAEGILEWNQGGHFSEPDLRIAKGIDWILKQFDV